MMPVVVDDVSAVGGRVPDIFGKKIVLRFFWPVGNRLGMPFVHALDFLQKDDVRAERSQLFAQFVHHHVAVELGKPLVNVVRDDVQVHRVHRGSRCVEHLLHCESGQLRLVFRDADLIDDMAVGQVLERPCQVLRVDALHG